MQQLFSEVEQPTEESRKVYPEDIFDYIYASLHSPSYREKYKEFLKTDFPRVPRPESWAEFWRNSNRVCINKDQYFGNIPDLAWDFYIGGYQPAQKWLKDRRGRTLTANDIDHYQRIIKILIETYRIMKEIG